MGVTLHHQQIDLYKEIDKIIRNCSWFERIIGVSLHLIQIEI